MLLITLTPVSLIIPEANFFFDVRSLILLMLALFVMLVYQLAALVFLFIISRSQQTTPVTADFSSTDIEKQGNRGH
jgi:hypothetical protein